MSGNGGVFDQIEQVLRGKGPQAGFDFLAQKFREEKKYPLLFETRLMKKRHELGLPLIRSDIADDLPPALQRPYEEAFIEAAREVGGLFLADGDIARAWPYFRAIGETAPVFAAIETADPREGLEPIIEIAFHERVHPRKGFELILRHYGICRAISAFGQYPDRKTRQECLQLLVRTLHSELVDNLARRIEQVEGQAPSTRNISDLISGRGWLFEGNTYYVDTSHLVSILQYSLDLTDPPHLSLALEMAAYGQCLSPMFHYQGEPPFENIYADHAAYLRALLGIDEEGGIAHFRAKLAQSNLEAIGPGPAQVLVNLLTRLKRYPEAIDVVLHYLGDADPNQLACPSAYELCQLAGDYGRLKKLARDKGDLLAFAAAALNEG